MKDISAGQVRVLLACREPQDPNQFPLLDWHILEHINLLKLENGKIETTTAGGLVLSLKGAI